MRKKSINKSLYESIMTGVSKAVKRLLLLNEMNRRPLIESTFTDDDADLLDDESGFDKYSLGRYNGIQGLINASDKDKVFKFGTILFVKGGFKAIAANNNLRIIADNFENPTFDVDELNRIRDIHEMEGREPFAFCFGKNDEGKYVFGLPRVGEAYIDFCDPYVLKYLDVNARYFSKGNYDNNIMTIGEMIKNSHGKVTGNKILRFGEDDYTDNLLYKIYEYKNMFNNKLNIDAPDEYVFDLLKRLQFDTLSLEIIYFSILHVYHPYGIWSNRINIKKGLGCCSSIGSPTDYYVSTAKQNDWFLTFTL